ERRVPRRVRRPALRRARLEEPVAPLPRLDEAVAAGGARAPRAVELRRRRQLPGIRGAERLPPHADRVDLVDEDDALAAPLARGLLRLAGEVAHDDRVDADERLREARARDRDEGRVEARRDRLREHRLAGTRWPQEEQAALALAARGREELAGLPQRDDAA